MRVKLSNLILSAVVTTTFVACGDDDDNRPGTTSNPPPTAKNIVEVAAAAGNFQTLVGALEATDLDEVLSGEGPFTVFAPTDDAFARLPSAFLAGASSEVLTDVLTYHVVAARVPASDVVMADSAATVQGGSVSIRMMNDKVYLNGIVQVTMTDIEASNGIIHVIDAVLLPRTMAFPGSIVEAALAYPAFDTLTTAVVAADLADTLAGSTFTIFAPTNDAFAKLPDGTVEALLEPSAQADLQGILTYHAVSGNVSSSDVVELVTAETAQGSRVRVSADSSGVMINDAKVIWTDLHASNGTIHVIDSVILPPSDIIAEAEAVGSFSTLIGAIDAFGLTSTLQGEGPFTVFAPTDDAFAAINASGDLTDILTYHVIGAYVDSKAAVGVAESGAPYATTLSAVTDNDIFLSMYGGYLVINGTVQVTVTDIVASNGIIHVVDAVMLPSSVPFPGDIVNAVSAYPIFSSLVDAVVAADLVDALRGDNGGDGFTVFVPTNAAFKAIEEVAMNLSVAELTNVLLYHVVPGTFDSTDVGGISAAPTLESTDIAIDTSDGVTLNGESSVIWTDIRTENGIIHVIDSVLIP